LNQPKTSRSHTQAFSGTEFFFDYFGGRVSLKKMKFNNSNRLHFQLVKPQKNLIEGGWGHRDWGFGFVLACSIKIVPFVEKRFLFHLPAFTPTATKSFDVKSLASLTTNTHRQEKVIQRFWQIIAAFFP